MNFFEILVCIGVAIAAYQIAKYVHKEHTEYSYYKSMIDHLTVTQGYTGIMLTASEIEEFLKNYRFKNRQVQSKEVDIDIVTGNGHWEGIGVIELVVMRETASANTEDGNDQISSVVETEVSEAVDTVMDKIATYHKDNHAVFVTTGYGEYRKYRSLVRKYQEEQAIRKRVNSIPSVYDWIRNS